MAKKIMLKVIPEPDPNTRSVFIYKGEGTVIFEGDSANVEQCCGSCGAPLTIGVPPERIRNLVLKCNACGAFNETLSA